MSGFDLTKYRQMFLEESVELFETIDTLLLEAEANGMLEDEEMNSLFRAMHTLKGGSASVELREFALFTHEVESFLDKLRNHQLDYQPHMADVLIDCADTMQRLLEEELNDTIESVTYNQSQSLLIRLKECEDTEESSIPEELISSTVDFSSESTQDYGRFGSHSHDKENFGFCDEHELSGSTPSLQNENFGFFDESQSRLEDSDAFGFFEGMFDETIISNEDSSSAQKPQAFGFFDENLNITPVVTSDNEAFGFFDDLEEKLPFTLAGGNMISAPKVEKVITTDNEVQETIPETKKSASPTNSTGNGSATSSIRVDLGKIDHLMNNIGELVIANSMLSEYTQTITDSRIQSDILERLSIFSRHIRELQESVMSVRMVPMETIYAKFPKVIRDTAKKLGKKVEYRHVGDTVEIDKVMIEGLTDPLTHIVRNALDHGIEMPAERTAKGKPEFGTVIMSAEQSNGQIIITIQDDGAGINLNRVTAKAVERGVIDAHQANIMSREEKAMLIFSPGLSTADKITDISGRGVGMDVVLSNIKKLGGNVMITTEEGYGTTLTIALPLTLAILDGLNVGVGKQQYILPLAVIIESLQPTSDMIKQVGDKSSEILMLRNEFIPIVRLHKLFGVNEAQEELSRGMLIVVRIGNQKIALFVDSFLDQQQFVVKPLDKNFRTARGIGGATVRGDGSIGLIIDVMSLLDKNEHHEKGNA